MNATLPLSLAAPPSCAACPGHSRTEWCALAEGELELLDAGKGCATFRAGQTIVSQGQPQRAVYCILSGSVALRRADADGNSIIVGLASAGQTFGYREHFAGEPHSTTAEALTEARLCVIDRGVVDDLVRAQPELGLRFLKRLAGDLEKSEKCRLGQVTMSVRARLADLLLSLRDDFGHIDEAGDLVLELPLARQDLAATIGARPESISRAIRELEEDAVAKFSGRFVTVPDLDALLDAAGAA